MRVGEATGLRWCDVDFENSWIDVNHTLIYGCGKGRCTFAINDTKTPTSKRKIPMTEQVKQAFLQEKKIQNEMGVVYAAEMAGYTDFVFVNRFGGLYNQSTINNAHKRIIRDCNDVELLKSENPKVLLPNFNSYNLRHTFVTRLCGSGMNMKMVQDILGHTDISTTMDLYTHVTQEMRQEEKEYMENVLHMI